MATPFDKPIVAFTTPPVIEVVAGVGFEDSDPQLGPVLAAFWQTELRSSYPLLEYQAPYVPPREQFDGPTTPRAPQFQIEFGPGTPFPRMWLSSVDQQELVQLHPRYFACNWRRVQPDAKYDNWAKRRSAFTDVFERLTTFLERTAVPLPKVSQCEVTYINQIVAGGIWGSHSEWWRIFNVQFGSSPPHSVERLSAEAQFVIDRPNATHARLHCKVFPAFDPAGEAPIYILELTVRGAPAGSGLNDILSFMDDARQAIDETFISVTTPAMHQEWGMQK